MDNLQRENDQLRRLVSDLIFGSTFTTSPGKEPRPMLTLPIPCACGNTIIQQLTFDSSSFKFTQVGEIMATAKVEGTIEETHVHGIRFYGNKLCCMKCGREVIWPDTGADED